jgi:hypothetical protein
MSVIRPPPLSDVRSILRIVKFGKDGGLDVG